MPYIDKLDRNRLDVQGWVGAKTPGELNYLFTMICREYMRVRGESYQTYNDMIGALEGCKLELYRRRVAGYEDTKRWKNGDVWEEPERDTPVDSWGKVIEK